MKITIDTTNKTLLIEGETNIAELVEFINKLPNSKEYRLIPKETPIVTSGYVKYDTPLHTVFRNHPIPPSDINHNPFNTLLTTTTSTGKLDFTNNYTGNISLCSNKFKA